MYQSDSLGYNVSFSSSNSGVTIPLDARPTIDYNSLSQEAKDTITIYEQFGEAMRREYNNEITVYYALIYLDNDDIPECNMYYECIEGGKTVSRNHVMGYKNGRLSILPSYIGTLQYQEYSGKFKIAYVNGQSKGTLPVNEVGTPTRFFEYKNYMFDNLGEAYVTSNGQYLIGKDLKPVTLDEYNHYIINFGNFGHVVTKYYPVIKLATKYVVPQKDIVNYVPTPAPTKTPAPAQQGLADGEVLLKVGDPYTDNYWWGCSEDGAYNSVLRDDYNPNNRYEEYELAELESEELSAISTSMMTGRGIDMTVAEVDNFNLLDKMIRDENYKDKAKSDLCVVVHEHNMRLFEKQGDYLVVKVDTWKPDYSSTEYNPATAPKSNRVFKFKISDKCKWEYWDVGSFGSHKYENYEYWEEGAVSYSTFKRLIDATRREYVNNKMSNIPPAYVFDVIDNEVVRVRRILS